MKPTAEEIMAEVKKLTEMKPTVLHFSGFGDNHHDAIDAQIDVLTARMSEEDAYEEYEGDTDNVRFAISHALSWMSGDDDEAPSVGWKELVR